MYTENPLHTDLSHTNAVKQKPVHTRLLNFKQQSLHTEALTYRRLCPQNLAHRKACAGGCCHMQRPLHIEAFRHNSTHKRLYIHTLYKMRSFWSQRLLDIDIDAFAERSRYTQSFDAQKRSHSCFFPQMLCTQKKLLRRQTLWRTVSFRHTHTHTHTELRSHKRQFFTERPLHTAAGHTDTFKQRSPNLHFPCRDAFTVRTFQT